MRGSTALSRFSGKLNGDVKIRALLIAEKYVILYVHIVMMVIQYIICILQHLNKLELKDIEGAAAAIVSHFGDLLGTKYIIRKIIK